MSGFSAKEMKEEIDRLTIENVQLTVETSLLRKVLWEALPAVLSDDQIQNLKSHYYGNLKSEMDKALNLLNGSIDSGKLTKKRFEIFEKVDQSMKD